MNTPVQTDNSEKFKAKIPAAVLEAARRADEIMAAVNAQAQPGSENEDPGNPEDPPQDPPTPVQDPPQGTSQGQPPVEPKPKKEDWEQRYNSMKGRYDKQVEQNNSLVNDIRSLRQQMAAMEARIGRPVEPTAPTTIQKVTPEEEEAYGKELLEIVGRRARQEVQPQLDELQAENAKLRSKLDGVGGFVEASSERSMVDLMSQRVPNWMEQNKDPGFIEWLSFTDPYSGQVRQEMINDAWARHDGSRVVAFFEGYQIEAQATAPPATVAQSLNGRAQGAPPKTPLGKFAAPGKGKSAAPTGPVQEKPLYTQADLTRFYSDVAAGKWRGREVEKNRIDEDIFAAGREGRIR